MHVEYSPPRITPCWIPTTIKECKTRVKCQDEGEHLTTTHREPTHVLDVLVWAEGACCILAQRMGVVQL